MAWFPGLLKPRCRFLYGPHRRTAVSWVFRPRVVSTTPFISIRGYADKSKVLRGASMLQVNSLIFYAKNSKIGYNAINGLRYRKVI